MGTDVKQYNSQKDFTTLDAWKKARQVKLFFYNEVIPNLPEEENTILIFKFEKQQ